MEMAEEFSKYEKARILGARALQISMNAPVLIKISPEELEKINYDALKIAEIELESGVLPISIHRPMPEMKEEKLKRVVEKKLDDQKIVEREAEEEGEIMKAGEIMKIANPEEEQEDLGDEGESE